MCSITPCGMNGAVRCFIQFRPAYAWVLQIAGPSGRTVCGRSPAEIVGSNPTGGMDVCCESCVLSGRGLCDELITRPEEYYRRWCVVECDLETSRMKRPSGGLWRQKQTATYRSLPFLNTIFPNNSSLIILYFHAVV